MSEQIIGPTEVVKVRRKQADKPITQPQYAALAEGVRNILRNNKGEEALRQVFEAVLGAHGIDCSVIDDTLGKLPRQHFNALLGALKAAADILPPVNEDGTSAVTQAHLKIIKASADAAARVDGRDTEQKERLRTFFELCDEFVYVAAIDRFIERDHERRFFKIEKIEAARALVDDETWYTPAVFDRRFDYARLNKKKKVVATMMARPDGTIRKIEKIIYRPGAGEFPFGALAYNIWRPSSIKPKQGDTTIWNEHLAYLFPDEADRNHLLNWCARLLQNPAEKPRHALLAVGRDQGTGKSYIAEALARILGMHNVAPLGMPELTSNFNRWALTSKLLVIEELRAPDKREVARKLHPMISQDRLTINDKTEKTFGAEVCYGVFAMSNKEAAIPLDDTDRRYLVVRTYATPKDKAYYRRLYGSLKDADVVAAIAWELLNRKVGDYDGRGRAPGTVAKQDMIESGRTDVEAWLHENKHDVPITFRILHPAEIVNIMPEKYQRRPGIEETVRDFLLAQGAVRFKDPIRPGGRGDRAKRVLIAKRAFEPDLKANEVLKMWRDDRAGIGAADTIHQARAEFADVDVDAEAAADDDYFLT